MARGVMKLADRDASELHALCRLRSPFTRFLAGLKSAANTYQSLRIDISALPGSDGNLARNLSGIFQKL
jgi:hypothetical protein